MVEGSPGSLPEARAPQWVLPSLISVFVFGYLRMFFVVGGRVTDEELHTPTVAALIDAGHPWDLPALQYMSFCGGCTAETLLVLPLFHVFGPSLAIWRLLGLLAGLGLLLLSWLILSRQYNWRAAALGCSVLVVAPGFYRENGVVSFGSHYEVMVLVLAATLVWQGWIVRGRARDGFLVGLLLGLAFWFSYSSGFAVPVLLGLWAVTVCRSRGLLGVLRQGLPAVLGLLLGLAPLVLTQIVLRAEGLITAEPPLAVYGRGLGALLAGPPSPWDRLMFLLGPSYWTSFLHPSFGPESPVPGFVYALVQAGLVGVGGFAFFRTVFRRPQPGAGTSTQRQTSPGGAPLVPALGGMAVLYLVLFVVLAPIQGPVPPPAPVPGNNLRYFVPLIPILSLLAAPVLLSGLAGSRTQHWMARLGISVLLGVGGVAFVSDLTDGKASLEPLSRVAVDYAALEGRGTLPVPPMPDLKQDMHFSQISSENKHRFALRVFLHVAGKTYGESVGNAPPVRDLRALEDWLSGLRREERWVVLQSLVARTQPTVLDPGSPAAEDPFGRLLASAGPELRFELWRQVYLARSDLLWGLHEDLEQARPSWGRWVQEGLPNERLRALSWALGAMSGYTYRQLQSAEAEAERSLRLVERLGPLEPSDYLHGLGVGLGQRWGYDPSVRADLIRRVGEVGSIDAFTAGFDMASELHFVRP